MSYFSLFCCYYLIVSFSGLVTSAREERANFLQLIIRMFCFCSEKFSLRIG